MRIHQPSKWILSTGLIFLLNLSLAQSITLSPTNLNGRQGIGIETPGTTLEVASQSSGNGINISGLGNGFKTTRISFWSNRLTSNEWRPAYIQSGDNGNYGGRLDFYTNGIGVGNKIGAMRTMSVYNGNVGIGDTEPLERLHIAGGDMLIENDVPFLKLKRTDTNNAGLQFLDSGGTPTGQIYQSSGNRMYIFNGPNFGDGITLFDNNNVGIGNPSPSYPLQVRRGTESQNGLTGAVSIGNVADAHLNIDPNEIDAYNASNGGAFLYLNRNAKSNVVVGSPNNTGNNLTVNNFTQLGNDAPLVRQKLITGTVSNASSHLVSHGLSRAKILDIAIFIGDSFLPNVDHPPHHDNPPVLIPPPGEKGYRYKVDNSNVELYKIGLHHRGEDFRMLITFME